jgi:hypothetical protein
LKVFTLGKANSRINQDTGMQIVSWQPFPGAL